MPKLEIHLNKKYICTAEMEGDHIKWVPLLINSLPEKSHVRQKNQERIIIKGKSLNPNTPNQAQTKWIDIVPQLNDEITIKILEDN